MIPEILIAAAGWFVDGPTAYSPAAISYKSPASMPAEAPVNWFNVTLGEDIDAVIKRLGPPAARRKYYVGSNLLEWPIKGTFGSLNVIERDHKVSGIKVTFAQPPPPEHPVSDPYGVKLGDTLTALMNTRGAAQVYDDHGDGEITIKYAGPLMSRWVYDAKDNRIVAVSVIAPPPVVVDTTPPQIVVNGPVPSKAPRPGPVVIAAPPTAAPKPSATPAPGPTVKATTLPPTAPAVAVAQTPDPGDGGSLKRAIIIKAPDEFTGFSYIYQYLATLDCGNGGKWQAQGQTIVNGYRRNFAQVETTCTTTSEKKTWFFDITSFFGKGG